MCNEELGAHLNFELFIGGVSWRRCSNVALDFKTPADIATEARIRDGDALQISSMSAWVESTAPSRYQRGLEAGEHHHVQFSTSPCQNYLLHVNSDM